VSRHQKGKTYLDFTETRDSEWQWHPLSHTQVCTLLQTDNHASTSPLSSIFTGTLNTALQYGTQQILTLSATDAYLKVSGY